MSEKPTILVTGGAGYIGSHTCKALKKSGFRPVVFDNLSSGDKDFVKWGPLVIGDIRDTPQVEKTIAAYKPIAVIHFAGLISVGESVANPDLYYQNNVTGSLSLLEAMVNTKLKTIVFSSSAAVYGTPNTFPVTEDSPLSPINPYAENKLAIEEALKDFHKAHGFNYAALRYFNACGADPDGEVGENHNPETHLIPRAIMAANGEIDCLQIFGDDYDTPDGTCVRDYIHVSDLARAHVLSVQHLLQTGTNLTINLGTGTGRSVQEILTAVGRVSGKEVPIEMHPRRAGDPAVLYASADRALKQLAFKPRYTDIDEIINTAWNYHTSKATN